MHNMNSEVKFEMKQIKKTRYIENKSAHSINTVLARPQVKELEYHWPSNIDGGSSLKTRDKSEFEEDALHKKIIFYSAIHPNE